MGRWDGWGLLIGSGCALSGLGDRVGIRLGCGLGTLLLYSRLLRYNDEIRMYCMTNLTKAASSDKGVDRRSPLVMLKNTLWS